MVFTISAPMVRRISFTLAAAISPAFAQTDVRPPASAAPKLPVYDVAVIKANDSDDALHHNMDIWTRDTEFKANNAGTSLLLESAFGTRHDLILGLPAWAEAAHFDVDAKVVDPDMALLRKLTPEQHRMMLQILFADRFKLKWHYETRMMPVYELLSARTGSKLRIASSDAHAGMMTHNTTATAHDQPVTHLVDLLSLQLQRPVVDKTDLTGNYDFELKWSRTTDTGADNGTKEDADAPDIFTAVQEQLGLKLQSGKAPVQVLVIDHIEPPTAN